MLSGANPAGGRVEKHVDRCAVGSPGHGECKWNRKSEGSKEGLQEGSDLGSKIEQLRSMKILVM